MAAFLRRVDRPRILYVIQQHDYSGAELLQVPLLQEDVDPLLACPPGSRSEALARELGIPTVALPFRPLRHSGGALETVRSLFRGLASVRDLRRVLRSHPERTIIHCTSLRPGMLAALAKLGLRRRSVWVVTDLLPPAPLRQLTRLLARVGCDLALPLSQYTASDFVGRSPALRRRTRVAYPGAELERFHPERASPGSPSAAVLGHVSPTKRIDVALEVARRVAAEDERFQLSVVGRPQYRDEDFEFERELRERVASDDLLREHVRFVGYADDVASELAGFGVLLHCRPDEPFGMALVEGMAAGLPVVAPASGGPNEIVEHEVTGLLYKPGDADHAARHVLRLLRDPEEATRMGRAARLSAERRFAAGAYVETVDRLVEEALGAAPEAASSSP